MKISTTPVQDCVVITPNLIEDDRGYFTCIFCNTHYKEAVNIVDFDLCQVNQNFNRCKGTLRGLHMQTSPHEECKIVRCISGSVQDVIVDIRPSSPTYLKYASILLDSSSANSVVVPKGCLHGYLTLDDNSTVTYLVDHPYTPGLNLELGLMIR